MLYKADYESHRLRNPARAPGTCEWVFRHPKYQQWRQVPQSSLLWISADPGCGKSVLASFLIDEFCSLPFQAKLPSTVCFFFFKDDSDEQNNATLALNAIAHQLFRQNPGVIHYALQELQAKGTDFSKEFPTMWNIIRAAVSDSRCSNILCVIDALDECEESSRRLLMKALVDFFKIEAGAPNYYFKVVVTGRPYAALEKGFVLLPSIRLRAEDEETRPIEDIRLYISHRVHEVVDSLNILGPARVDALIKTLTSKADQSFIWVSLIMDQLEKSVEGTERELLEIVSNMPDSLNDTYEKMLRRTPSAEKARRILRVMLAASRPLTLQEMNIALALQLDTNTLAKLDLMPNPESSIKQLCGLFVRVVSSRLYLVHQTAREFLFSDQETESANSWKHSIGKVASQTEMCKICVNYLTLTDFQMYASEIDEGIERDKFIAYKPSSIRRYLKACYDKYPFLEYASCNWTDHFRAVRMEDSCYVEKALSLCSAPYTYSTIWILERLIRDRPADRPTRAYRTSPFLIATEFGLLSIVRYLAAHESKLALQAVLGIAAENGSLEMAELTIQHGAKVRGNEVQTLFRAASHGHAKTVSTLLNHGAEVGFLNKPRVVPPDWNHGEEPSGSDSDSDLFSLREREVTEKEAQGPLITLGETALHQAIGNWKNTAGHWNTILLLLNAGANVRQMTTEPWGANALDLAASRDAIDLLGMLLHRDPPDFDLSDVSKAFVFAARFSASRAVRFLAGKGADINTTDAQGRDILSLVVAQCDRLRPMKLQRWDTLADLLELGAEINESVLLLAVGRSNMEVIQYLLHRFLIREHLDEISSERADKEAHVGQKMLELCVSMEGRYADAIAQFLVAEGAKHGNGEPSKAMDVASIPFGSKLRQAIPDFRANRVSFLRAELERLRKKEGKARIIRSILDELGDTSEAALTGPSGFDQQLGTDGK